MALKYTFKQTKLQNHDFLSFAGSLGHLLEYETSRQRHVTPTLLSIDALYRLYRTAWTPVVVARTLGLQASNAFTPLKVSL